MNPTLTLNVTLPGLDVHQDTPVENLHTFLLGVVKYFWAQTIHIMTETKVIETFRNRLNSVSEPGLDVPKILGDYMCRYSGGLVGKHFKTLCQIMTFLVHDIVDADLFEAWDRIGEIAIAVWQTGITDLVKYTVSAFKSHSVS